MKGGSPLLLRVDFLCFCSVEFSSSGSGGSQEAIEVSAARNAR